MNFWLQDKDPEDAARATRWAPLRKMQDEVLKTPPPPRGRWTFIPEKTGPL